MDDDAIECAKEFSFEAEDALKDILLRKEDLSEELKVHFKYTNNNIIYKNFVIFKFKVFCQMLSTTNEYDGRSW